jgi:2-aminoadipate transaminase
MPSFHNPTGRTLEVPARKALAELADEYDLLIIEDDPYGLLRIDGEQPPYVHDLLCERGRSDLALFASSFSKTVAPGLRVGYLLLPKQLVEPVEALATSTYVSPPLLSQAQLLEFVRAGYLEPHVERLRSSLRSRRNALLATLDEGMPAGTHWTRPAGGYFLWLELPEALDAREVNELARAAGVTFVPGSGFFPDGRGQATARISFSFPSVEEVSEGGRRLASVVRAALEGQP